MSLIQLLKFKTWETRLFKMPRLGTPRFQMRRWVTVAFVLELSAKKVPELNSNKSAILDIFITPYTTV